LFSYFLSVAILFIVLGVIRNILAKVKPDLGLDEDIVFSWLIVALLSLLWFIAIPVLFIILILYVLKILTDKIANVIVNRINSKEKEDV
jgi:hypothetical protein